MLATDWTAIGALAALLSWIPAVAAVYIGVRALKVAGHQTRVAEITAEQAARQTSLAERFTRPELWIEPEELTDEGKVRGEANRDGAFQFRCIVGNSGGTAAVATTVCVLVDDEQVSVTRLGELKVTEHQRINVLIRPIKTLTVVSELGGSAYFGGSLTILASARNAATVTWPVTARLA